MTPMKWFFSFLKKYRGLMIIGILLTTAVSVLSVVNPYISGQIVDQVISGGRYDKLMPFIGWALGTQFESYITSIDHWIAFVLLAFIGGKMIAEAVRPEDENVEIDKMDPPLDLKEMLVLAVATSIDALAVGISLACIESAIALEALTIGIVTFLLSAFGVYFGNHFGRKIDLKLDLIGGLILIGIGTKILIEHLYFNRYHPVL